MVPFSHHLGYMEATEKRNYPYYIKLRYTPPKGTLGIFVVAPSDRCPTTAFRLASTQALRPRCVSSASKSLDNVVAHRAAPQRSDRSSAATLQSSALALWMNQGT
jgi:hypothetical protein